MEANMPNTLSPVTLSAIAASAIAASMLVMPAAHSQESVANLGTLTCTSTGAPEEPGADVKLSCNFKSWCGA
jgi:hypothetical protein